MSSHSELVPDASSESSAATNRDSNSTPDFEPDVIVVENDDNANESGHNTDNGRPSRSDVWAHFTNKVVDGSLKAICNYCRLAMKCDSGCGTSHLRNHYNKKYKKKPMQSIRQRIFARNSNKSHPKLATYSLSYEAAKKELAKMIIMHKYPNSMVDHIGFKRYSAQLQILFKVPCRNTIKSEIFLIYEFEKAKTTSLLGSITSDIAITTDMWTASNKKKGYMAVTTHFIDNSWTLQSRIMRFIYVPCPHTKEVLCDHLLECLMDWNMDRKILCLTLDNCSANDAMVEILLEKMDTSSFIAGGNLFHMRCSAHILNLIVKDGLEIIKTGVEKIRDFVAYWTATPKREEKFEETSRQLRNTHTKKLGLDFSTRWNSTYLMLETALLYQNVFTHLAANPRESKYKCKPSKEEWEFAQDVCGRLKSFYKATEIFPGTKYLTINLSFINICEIYLVITEWRKSSDFVIQTMVEKMLIKFDKYWDVMHGVVGVSAVLDPRYKMEVLEFDFEKKIGDRASIRVDNVRDLCYSLLREYHDKKVTNKEGIGDSNSNGSVGNFGNASALQSQYDIFICTKKRKRLDHLKSELDHYLDEDVLPKSEGFDVLNWWKANELKYPTLQLMARDFLVVPASTVASKSAFSISGRLVSPHRNRLHPKTIKPLMCSQSWLWAVEMNGKAYLGYATIYNDMELEDSCMIREV